MLKALKQHRKLILCLLIIMVGVFVVGQIDVYAQANESGSTTGSWITGKVASAVGWIVEKYVSVIGWIALQLMYILVVVASYNEFVTSKAVTEGWVIIRDIVNMLFIVVLLVVAFATIFNVKEYKYQVMLPRLLIMAVVINFSRTICGIFIDLGQVIMLTFVNGFQEAAGGNFVNALHIDKLMKFDQQKLANQDINIGWVFMGFILAAIMVTITAVVIGAMVLILVMRMVILWFLVVLSPLAFMASVWPTGKIKEQYSTWWKHFLDNVMVGPILAFFLWLSLLVLGSSSNIGGEMITKSGVSQAEGEKAGVDIGITEIGTAENMISYILGIGMLLGSLYMAQSMRSAGSSIAGGALKRISSYSKSAMKKTAMLPARAGREATGVAGRGARKAAIPALDAVSKFKIPLVSGLALKGASRLQKQEKERYDKVESNVSGFNKTQVKTRIAQLKSTGGQVTDSQQKELVALQKRRLDEIKNEQFIPKKDENGKPLDINKDNLTKEQWQQNLAQEYKAASSDLKKAKTIFPEIDKELENIERTRPDLLDKDAKREVAKNTNTLADANKLDKKAWEDSGFVNILNEQNPKMIDVLEEKGTAEQKKGISQWKKSQGGGIAEVEDFRQRVTNEGRPDYLDDRAIANLSAGEQTAPKLNSLAKSGRIEPLIESGNISIASADLEANGGIIAKQVAVNGSEELKNKFKNERREDYVSGLRESMKTPGDHSKERAELLRLGEDVSAMYKIDEKGEFASDEAENKFKTDIKNVPKRDVAEIVPKLKGEAKHQALEALDRTSLANQLNRAQSDGSEEAIEKAKQLLNEYISAASTTGASENMKKNAKQIYALPAFRPFLKKESASEKEAPEEYSGSAREVELPEEASEEET